MSACLSTLFDFYSRNFLPTPSPPVAPATKTSSYDVVHAGERLFKIVGHSMFKDDYGLLTSEPFSVGGYDRALVYYPNGAVDAQFTSLFLQLLSASEDGVTASYSFSLEDLSSPTTGGEKNKCKGCIKFSSSNNSFGKCKFMSKADLAASGCLKDDCIVIKGTVEIVTTKLIENREHDDDDNSFVMPPSDLSEDLHDLLDSDLKTDMTVKIGWFKQFQVHGCLFAAHSPVFGALLAESKQNTIRINDIDANVFEVLLHYVYNDSLPDFMEETTEEAVKMARHLLVVADRYAIQRLKLICQSKLCKVIDVNTVGFTLAFAEEHSCQQLKACCVEYMVRDGDRLRAIMKTEGFGQLEKNHPHVMDNILNKFIDKL